LTNDDNLTTKYVPLWENRKRQRRDKFYKVDKNDKINTDQTSYHIQQPHFLKP